MTSEIRANKQTNRVGLGTVEYTNTGIIVSGIVTCTQLSGLTALNIAGVGTANTLDINGDIDVDGHTELDNVNIVGVTTHNGQAKFYGNGGAPLIWGDTGYSGHLSFDGSNNAVIRAASGKALKFQTDHVNTRMTIGSQGNVSIEKDLDVDGHTNLDNVSIAGITTHQDDVAIRSSNPLILSNAANNASCQVLCDGGARLHFKSYNQTMATFENGQAIIFYTDSGQNRLQISNNGNVLIAKDLDVNGHTNLDNVSISGIVTTTQFKVTTGANAFETSANVFKGASGQKGVYLRSALSSATTPSYSSVDDTNTGIFLPGSDVFAVTTGGTERLNINSNGDVTIDSSSNSMQPGAAVNIISDKNVETGVDDMANYHLVLKNPQNDTGEAIGLAFGITDTVAKVGAAIIHERDAAGSQGSMKFFTRPNNAGPPVERFRITSSGTAIFGGNTSAPIVDNGELYYRGNSTKTFQNLPQNFYLYSDDIAYNATNPGAGMLFGGAFHSNGSYTTFSGIHGVKQNNTDGDVDGIIVFGTRQTGSSSWERARLTSEGTFSIGNTNPDTSNYRLECAGSARFGTGSFGSKIVFARSGLGDELVIGVDGYGNSTANEATIQSSINFPRPLVFATNNQERLRIHSNGAVTKPYNPVFIAYRVSNYSLTTTETELVYESEKIDVGGNYNPSNGRFTAPVDGLYEFAYASIAHNSNTVYRYTLKVNGNDPYSPLRMELRLHQASSEYATNGEFVVYVNMTAGQHASVYAKSDTNVSGVYGSSNYGYTYFRGRLIQ